MRKIVALLCLFASFAVQGQLRTVNIAVDYGLTVADSTKTVADKFTTGADTVRLKYAWERCKDIGWTYGKFRQLYLASAYGLDACWMGDPGYPKFIYPTFSSSMMSVEWGPGKWMVNVPIPVAGGSTTGAGSHKWYFGGNTSSTEFVIDNAKWLGDPVEHAAMETAMWGFKEGLGYNEGHHVWGFRITGHRYNEPFPHYVTAYNSHGIRVWKAGECSEWDNIYVDQCTYGMTAHGGVPLGINKLSFFNCSKAGFHGWGTSQATIRANEISCDDSEAAVLLEEGGGLPAGGIMFIGLLKSETGITDLSRGPHNGQRAIVANGQYTLHVGVISYACQAVRPDAAIVLNPTIGAPWNYGIQISTISVGGMVGFGYGTAVQDIVSGSRWASPGDHISYSINHTSYGGGILTSNYPLVRSACACKDALGFLKVVGGVVQGSFDYPNCLPVRGSSTPPPNPGPTQCTGYDLGAWGTCANGQQSRTVTPSPAGCTGTPSVPKPEVVQSCSATPPSTTVKWSSKSDYATTATKVDTRKDVPAGVNPITLVKLVNFKAVDLNFAYVNSSLFVGQGGTFWTSPTGKAPWTDTGIKVTPGVAMNKDIPIAGATLTQVVGCVDGATVRFTGRVEVY